MTPPLLDEILGRIARAHRILIFSHIGPDGDAFGSALGLMWLLRAQGKAAEVSFADPVPPSFRFLPGSEEVADRPVSGHELVIAVDGSDGERYGATFSAVRALGEPFAIGIDHHKTNTLFADLNWVDSRYAATAQMIYTLARHAGWTIPPEAATCLATGCVTDTNAFSTDHTTPEVLETVAFLMRAGAPLSTIMRQAMSLRTPSDAHLWGRILSTLQIETGVAWAINHAAARREVGATEDEGGGIATFIRDIVGVNVGLLFVEVDAETVRLSMRSRPAYDVGALAFSLGGGGHTQAAGATLHLPLDEAVALVVAQAQAITPLTPSPTP